MNKILKTYLHGLLTTRYESKSRKMSPAFEYVKRSKHPSDRYEIFCKVYVKRKNFCEKKISWKSPNELRDLQSKKGATIKCCEVLIH